MRRRRDRSSEMRPLTAYQMSMAEKAGVAPAARTVVSRVHTALATTATPSVAPINTTRQRHHPHQPVVGLGTGDQLKTREVQQRPEPGEDVVGSLNGQDAVPVEEAISRQP